MPACRVPARSPELPLPPFFGHDAGVNRLTGLSVGLQHCSAQAEAILANRIGGYVRTLLASVIPDASRGHGARLRPREARAGASSFCRSSTGRGIDGAARQLLHCAVTVTYRPLRAMPRTSVNRAKRVRFARFGACRDAAWALAASAAPLFAPPRAKYVPACRWVLLARWGRRSGGASRRRPGLSLRVS